MPLLQVLSPEEIKSQAASRRAAAQAQLLAGGGSQKSRNGMPTSMNSRVPSNMASMDAQVEGRGGVRRPERGGRERVMQKP